MSQMPGDELRSLIERECGAAVGIPVDRTVRRACQGAQTAECRNGPEHGGELLEERLQIEPRACNLIYVRKNKYEA